MMNWQHSFDFNHFKFLFLTFVSICRYTGIKAFDYSATKKIHSIFRAAICAILLLAAIIAIIVLVVLLQQRISYDANRTKLPADLQFFDEGVLILNDDSIFKPLENSKMQKGSSAYLKQGSNLTEIQLYMGAQATVRLEDNSTIHAAYENSSEPAEMQLQQISAIVLYDAAQLVMHSTSNIYIALGKSLFLGVGALVLERGAKINAFENIEMLTKGIQSLSKST